MFFEFSDRLVHGGAPGEESGIDSPGSIAYWLNLYQYRLSINAGIDRDTALQQQSPCHYGHSG
jgi:hypothetical protein